MNQNKNKEKIEHRINPIPARKKKLVDRMKNLLETKKTVLIASIKNLPAKQFQEISKMLRGKATVQVPKKSLIFRAIENSKQKEVKELEDYFKEGVAVLFSDMDAFDIAGELIKKKTPAKAKPGQEAPQDIVIRAGPTDLAPGPAISELGAVGIPIEIKEGKINIKTDKTIVKQGEKISQEVADVMSKLDIKPFSIGFIPVCAFDTEEKKLYSEINIDTEETIKNLVQSYSKALAFAVEMGYTSKDTIGFLLGKANSHALKINRTITGEPEPETQVQTQEEKPTEESKQENKEETQGPSTEGLGALFG
ncbi:MAG: 50S ribosomal protein L10 [Nanoarchaeota archaeon]